jgi:hypothetical protein
VGAYVMVSSVPPPYVMVSSVPPPYVIVSSVPPPYACVSWRTNFPLTFPVYFFLSRTIMVSSHEDLLVFLEAKYTSLYLFRSKKVFPAKIVEIEKTRHAVYNNVTLSCVRATIVAVEKQ